MQDLIYFLTIINILKISLDVIKNLIDILKCFEDKKKNAKAATQSVINKHITAKMGDLYRPSSFKIIIT